MPKYRVQLNAQINVSYTMEVEAEDSADARTLAENSAPEDATHWDVISDCVDEVHADTVEELNE